MTVLYLLGQWAGLVGYVLFGMVFFFMARIPALEFFLGLPRLYRLHHYFGVAVFLLLFLHPLLIAASLSLSSLSAAVSLLSLNDHFILAGWVSLALLAVTFFTTYLVKLPYELWRAFHILSGLSFAFGVSHTFLSVSKGTVTWYVLIVLTSLGVFGFIYREFILRLIKKRYHYSVLTLRQINPRTIEIFLKPRGTPLQFEPGQFVYLIFHNSVPRESHPFTVASAPENPILRFVIRTQGDFTSSLKALHPGIPVLIEGPYGKIFSEIKKHTNKKQVWIAAGIGIAPFLSLLDTKEWKNVNADLHFFLRSKSDDVFSQDIKNKVTKDTSLRVFTHFDEQEGNPTLKAIEQLSGPCKSWAHIVICGPKQMTRSLKRTLKTHRSRRRISSEEFHLS